MGVATTSSAAKELEASSGIPSRTVAGFLNDRENALDLAKIELIKLKESLTLNDYSSHAEIPRIEIHKLPLDSEGINHGTARYTFDNERGEVFKSPDNIRNQLGNYLLDIAEGNKHKFLVSSFASSIGERLTTYEKVGTVEAVAARNALYLKQDIEIGELKYKIGTKQSEIANLQNTGNKEGKKILLVMDESSMTGIRDAADISRLAKNVGARVVFQGDIKQHGSVPAGMAFKQALEAGMNKSVLQETRRFDYATAPTKHAVALMNEGKMAEAINKLDRLEVGNDELSGVVAERYLKNIEELKAKGVENPRVGVVTVTNDDRKEINREIHNILSKNGIVTGASFVKQHLDNSKLTEAEHLHASMLRAAKVEYLVFRKSYKEIGVRENDAVRITGFEPDKNRVTIINAKGKTITFNPKQKDYFTAMTMEERQYGAGDRIEARANINFEDKAVARIDNGARGVVTAIDNDGATIKWAGASAREGFREVRLTNEQMRLVDLSYARTTFKEQGATTDREIIAISKTGAKVFNVQAAYVAGTRAKGNTEIVTSDYETMLRNSGKSVSKTTAIEIGGVKQSPDRQFPAKEIPKVKEQDITEKYEKTKTQEQDKSQQRSRNIQQGFVLE
jgi:hypothetical protein